MRANLDGSQVETLVETGRGDKDQHDQTRWCVGITTDPKLREIYWTQKGPSNGGQGRLLRANIDIPKGESPTNRSDIEVLFDQLPEPIDLELDLANRVLYWTDRGDPPRGNTVNRAAIDKKAAPEILITHLMEGIGIALDVPATGCSSPTLPVRSIPPISTDRTSATSSTPRAISPALPTPKSEISAKENQSCPTSPFAASHYRHGRHRRELERVVSGQRFGSYGDGCCTECRGRAEALC